MQLTKVKIKKGSQGLNLLRLVKLVALFTICNLLTYCRAACPGSATVPTESSFISGFSTSTSNKLANRGYSLTKSTIWKTNNVADDATLSGIEFTYSSDCCELADIVHMYGSSTANDWSLSITQKVTAVGFIYKKGGPKSGRIRDIWFKLADDSTVKTCGCSGTNCSQWTIMTLTGNLIGLATNASTGLDSLDAANPDLSVWVDSAAQCSECTGLSLGFASTIANKTYLISSSSITTEAFASNFGIICFGTAIYWVTYTKNGTTLNTAPTWLTFNYATNTFTYSIPTANTQVGTYTMTVMVY